MQDRLKDNGWYEIDVLDICIISYIIDKRVTRKEIKDEFNISKEKARSRLEKLNDKEIISKTEICRYCENDISECDCGNYAKKILYHKDPSDKMLEMKLTVKDLVDLINDVKLED